MNENRANLLTTKAWQAFQAKEFETSMHIYADLSSQIKNGLYSANIEICLRRIANNSTCMTQQYNSFPPPLGRQIILRQTKTDAIPCLTSRGSSKDLDCLLAFLLNNTSNIEKDDHTGRLVSESIRINASQLAKSLGLYYMENLILRHAARRFTKSEKVARALFWSSNRIGDFELCNTLVLRLRQIYGQEASEKQKSIIRKLETTPASQLSVFDYKTQSTPLRPTSKNKIAYILHNTLPYSSGGYATRADGLIKGIQRQGLSVITVSRPGYPLDIKEDLKPSDIPLVESVNGAEYRRLLSPSRKGLPALDYMKKSSEALENQLKNIRPALVMAASNHITAIPAFLAAKRLGLPFIYEVRGFWEVTRLSREPEFGQSPAYKIQVIMESLLAQRADHVFTLTEPMKEELVRRGVSASKISLLYNSCDPERFTPRRRDEHLAKCHNIDPTIPVIGYIGTFVAYEGLEDLAHACAKLKERGHEFRLLLVGNENASGQDRGPITSEIINIAKIHGFEDWLIMPGRVSHDEVESYYSLIDIAPFPRKPWPVCEMVSPIKPLEALAMEKAVVVSSVRALAEMIKNDETGIVFNKGSISSLAEQLAKLINDRELRTSLGQAGRRWVQKERTWNATGEIATAQILNIVDSIHVSRNWQ